MFIPQLGQQKQETKLEKIKRVVSEKAWVIGTSLFILGFPIYIATKL